MPTQLDIAAQQFGGAPVRPRFFASASYFDKRAQAQQQADYETTLNNRQLDARTRLTEQQAAQAEFETPFDEVRADRLRVGLANEGIINQRLAGINPQLPEARRQVAEIVQMGGLENPATAPLVKDAAQQIGEFDQARTQDQINQMREEQYAPLRERFIADLNALDAKDPDAPRKAATLFGKYPVLGGDDVTKQVFSTTLRALEENRQRSKLITQEKAKLSPTARNMAGVFAVEDGDEESGLMRAQAYDQAMSTIRKAQAMGLEGAGSLVNFVRPRKVGDQQVFDVDLDGLQAQAAALEGQYRQKRAAESSQSKATMDTIRQIGVLNAQLRTADEEKKAGIQDQIDALTQSMLSGGGGSEKTSKWDD